MLNQHRQQAFLFCACRKTPSDTVKAVGASNQDLCDDEANVTLLRRLHLKQENLGGQTWPAREALFPEAD